MIGMCVLQSAAGLAKNKKREKKIGKAKEENLIVIV